MVYKLVNLAALVSFGAAVLGDTIFGHAGLELVAAGLFLHVGSDTIQELLA